MSNYIPNPGFPTISTLDPQTIHLTPGTTYARLSSTTKPAFKALILNSGAVDLHLSLDGVTIDRTIYAGTEYEWSNPDGMIPFDLSSFLVKAASGTTTVRVLYR